MLLLPFTCKRLHTEAIEQRHSCHCLETNAGELGDSLHHLAHTKQELLEMKKCHRVQTQTHVIL